jgi:hypothetical protein
LNSPKVENVKKCHSTLLSTTNNNDVEEKQKLEGFMDDVKGMGVWQGVAMDSLKFHLGLPCATLYAL